MTSRAPLHGSRAIVLASASKAVEICEGLGHLGCDAVHIPTIELREIPAGEDLRRAFSELPSYEWVVFTSNYGVQFFCRQLRTLAGPGALQAAGPKVCAVGPATARRLRAEGIVADLVPAIYSAEGAVEGLTARAGGARSLAGMRFLFPCAREARDLLPVELRRHGALVDVIPVYENVPARPDPERLRSVSDAVPQLVVCTSPSAAVNFVRILGEETARRLFAGAVLAAIGPLTAHAIEVLCRNPDIVPEEHTVRSLLKSIESYFLSGAKG